MEVDGMAHRATIAGLLDAARARLDRLEPREAQAALSQGALLIDTRSADLRRENGVIPGSVHVPLSVLFWRLDPTSESADPRLVASSCGAAQPSRRLASSN